MFKTPIPSEKKLQISPLFRRSFWLFMLRSSAYSELYEEIIAMAATMNVPIEGLHTETGPGVLEAALIYDEALPAADKAALLKPS